MKSFLNGKKHQLLKWISRTIFNRYGMYLDVSQKSEFCFDDWEEITREAKFSFSQEGEDAIIQNLFSWKKEGFFVDIGAFHPYRYSNTFALYIRGWSGINVEPNPDLFKKFEIRKRDVNLNLGVASFSGEMPYYMMSEPALNTFSKTRAEEIDQNKNNSYFIDKTVLIQTRPLCEILNNYAKNKVVDYMNIDVETMELDVLKSNDWDIYCPTVISIEELSLNSEKNEINIFLEKLKYERIAKTERTAFYRKIEK